MKKTQVNIRLDEDTLNNLNTITKDTGKNRTDIIASAIMSLKNTQEKDNKQIELYKQQNQQLQLAVSMTKSLLDERERTITEIKKQVELLENQLKDKKTRKKHWWNIKIWWDVTFLPKICCKALAFRNRYLNAAINICRVGASTLGTEVVRPAIAGWPCSKARILLTHNREYAKKVLKSKRTPERKGKNE